MISANSDGNAKMKKKNTQKAVVTKKKTTNGVESGAVCIGLFVRPLALYVCCVVCALYRWKMIMHMHCQTVRNVVRNSRADNTRYKWNLCVFVFLDTIFVFVNVAAAIAPSREKDPDPYSNDPLCRCFFHFFPLYCHCLGACECMFVFEFMLEPHNNGRV